MSEPTVPLDDVPQSTASEQTVHVRPPVDASQPTIVPGSRPSEQEASAPEGRPFGRYRLLAEIGRGGMGRVWKAWDPSLSRHVALKQILGEADGSSEARARVDRFRREAQLAARLRHPHIVAVHDVGEVGGVHYFPADFVEGEPLDRAIERAGAEGVPLRQAVTWVRTVAEALAAAHAQGVVHRDVKPGNILIDAKGEPQVTDFGLAKEVDLGGGENATGSTLTLSGALVGTPQYMSPEQATGRTRELGPATDQFSLGVVLYELIAGQVPFAGANMREVLNAVAEADPPPPRRAGRAADRDLETICLKALEKEASRRYASMADLAADLGRWLDREPIRARPISLAARLARKVSRHRAAAIPIALLAAVLVGLAAWSVVARVQTGRELARALADARKAEAAGALEDARTDFRRALGIDAGNAEATAGADRIERAITARERDASAREALAQAGRVQDVLGRWGMLAASLRRLEEVRYDGSLSEADRARLADAAWPPFDEFMRGTPADGVSRGTMLAFAGWARRLAGRDEEGLRWMEEASREDPDLPYGPFMGALVDLGEYLSLLPPPDSASGIRRFRLRGRPTETPEMTARRKAMEPRLARAASAKVWGEGTSKDFRVAIEAIRAMEEGRYEEALSGLTASLGRPSLLMFRTELLLARARVRAYQGEFAKSLPDLDEVAAARPRWPEGHLHRGHARLAVGDPAGAIAAYDQALSIEPKDVPALLDRGIARWANGDTKGALADYDEVIRIDPGKREAWPNRSAFRMQAGDVAGAASDAEEAVSRFPAYPPAWLALAQARRARDDVKGAIEADSKAIALEGTFVEAWADRATSRHAARDLDGAIADEEAAIAIDGGVPLLWKNLASFVRGKGNPAAEIKVYERSVAAIPREGELWRLLGIARYGTGDLAGSEKAYDEAISIDPKDAEALAGRGGTRQGRGNVDAALADFNEAIRVNPKLEAAYTDRAVILYGKGELQRAMADCDAAVALDADDATAWHLRAIVRYAMGEAQEGIEDLSHAIQLDGSHADWWALCAAMRRGVGDLDGAIQDYEQALRVAPGDWPSRKEVESELEATRMQRGQK